MIGMVLRNVLLCQVSIGHVLWVHQYLMLKEKMTLATVMSIKLSSQLAQTELNQLSFVRQWSTDAAEEQEIENISKSVHSLDVLLDAAQCAKVAREVHFGVTYMCMTFQKSISSLLKLQP